MQSSEKQWMFKARPATVLKKKPFIPKLEKKFVEPKNIRLNTERRAQEWMVFEQEMKEKFSQYEEMSKQVPNQLLLCIIYTFCLTYVLRLRSKKKIEEEKLSLLKICANKPFINQSLSKNTNL